MTGIAKEIVNILNRFTGAAIFSAEIECKPDELPSMKLGLAVKCAVKARADLAGANLAGANLARANLARANLARAKEADYAIAQTRILPDGDLIGWKKLDNGTIAKLRIPADARRSHAFGRKCRAEFADVLEGEGVSRHDRETKYAPGLRVTCHKWEEDWTKECAGGVHFFITRIEAENY